MSKKNSTISHRIVCSIISMVLVFGMFMSVSYGTGENIDPLQQVILEAIDLDSETRNDFVEQVLKKVTAENYKDLVSKAKEILGLPMADVSIEKALESYALYPDTYKESVENKIKGFQLIEDSFDTSKFSDIANRINFEVTGDYSDDKGFRLFVTAFFYSGLITGDDYFYDSANPYKLDIKVSNNRFVAELDKLIPSILSLKARGINDFNGFVTLVEKIINSHSDMDIYYLKRFLADEDLGYSGALQKPEYDGPSISALQKVILEAMEFDHEQTKFFVDNILSKIDLMEVITDEDYNSFVSQVKTELLPSMTESDIRKALESYASYPENHKKRVKQIIRVFKLSPVDYKTSGFNDIARRINFEVTGDYDNGKGFKMFIELLNKLSVFTGDVLFDNAEDMYKLDIRVDGNTILKAELDQLILAIESLEQKGITTFDAFIDEAELIINGHSYSQIYYFKAFMDKYSYSGSLPNPVTPSPRPSSNPPQGNNTPRPATSPSTSPSPTPSVTPVVTEPAVTDVPAANPFTDLPDDHWAKDNILKLVAKKVISGYGDGNVKPNTEVTRAEMAVILVKAAGLEPVETPDLKFADKADIPSWAAGFIQTAVGKGIIAGYEDNTFRPSRKLTREEMVVLVLKTFGYEPVEEPTLSFEDAADIANWSKGYVAKAVELEFVKGYTDNTFKPKRNVTRAEASTVTVKCMDAAEAVVEEAEDETTTE